MLRIFIDVADICMKKMFGFGLFGLMAAMVLARCATPTVGEVKQSGDVALSCAQIKSELEVADNYLKAAKKDQNFPPGLLGTYVNTEEAITTAKERTLVLTKLADKKLCVESTVQR